MLLKCCTQYVSKFGKLSSSHRAGKGQFSFQSQKYAIPKNVQTVGRSTLKPPTMARHHSNHLHELFYTGGPGKKHGTNKPPPTGRVRERSKGDTTCPTTSQNPLWHPSWLNKVFTTRKDSESE